MSLSNATSSARDLVCVLQERLVGVVLDDLLGERQAVLALEVLADLVDVQLRAVLRVAAAKELQEQLRLLVDIRLRAAQRAFLDRRPVRRPHARPRPGAASRRAVGCLSRRCMNCNSFNNNKLKSYNSK